MGGIHTTFEEANTIEDEGVGAPAETIQKEKLKAEGLIVQAREFIEKFLSSNKNIEAKKHGAITESILDKVKELELELIQLENLVRAMVLASEDLPSEIESQGKDLKTKYEYKNSDEDKKRFESAIKPEMKKTLEVTLKGMKDRKFPLIFMGSGPLVILLGDKSRKLPKDADAAAGIPDLPQAYANFKALEKDEVIRNLEIIAITDIDGEANDCFEIRYEVKIEEGIYKEASVFFANIVPDKIDNGLISAGYKENLVHMYTMETEGGAMEIPMANRETEEILYAQNTLLEISTLIFEEYKTGQAKYAWVTPKALQRLNNLMLMNDGDLDKVFSILEKVKSAEYNKKYTDIFNKSFDFLKDLLKSFNSNRYGKEINPGLAEYICAENNYLEEHCMERATDHITENIKVQMKETYKLVTNSEKVFRDKEMALHEKKLAISQNYKIVESLYNEYSENLKLLNNQDSKDTVIGMGLIALEHEFLYPAAIELLGMLEILEKETNN